MSVDFWANTLAAIGVHPVTADDWADTFARVMSERPFSDDHDAPNFIGQVLHESSMLERLEESRDDSERITNSHYVAGVRDFIDFIEKQEYLGKLSLANAEKAKDVV